MDSEKKVALENSIIGILIGEEKYKFADPSLIAEVVRDTLRKVNWDWELVRR